MSQNDHKLNLVQSISYVVGSIIGGGIFITPVSVLKYSGSIGMSLIIWTICGILAMIGGLCYIELGTSIPKSGGDYIYMSYVGWKIPAFAFIWAEFILYKPCTVAISVKTAGSYVVEAVSLWVKLTSNDQYYLGLISGYLILSAIVYGNFYAIDRIAGNLQVAITIFKVTVLCLIIGTGLFYLIFREGNDKFQDSFANTNYEIGDLTLALYVGIWAYGGWDTLNAGLEEVKNPRRTLPLSLITSITLVMVIYLSTIISYITVLGTDSMLESKAVAASFSNVALGKFSYTIPIIVIFVAAGTLNGTVFTTSRVYKAVAIRGDLPSFMALVNIDTNSPRACLIVYTFSAILMSFVDNLETLVIFDTFLSALQRVVTICAILNIRFKRIPVAEGAIKMPILLHLIFLLCYILLMVFPIYRDPSISLVGIGVLFSGIIVYMCFIWPTKRIRILTQINEFVAKFTQKLLLSGFSIEENQEDARRMRFTPDLHDS